jgi:hypothetical protein
MLELSPDWDYDDNYSYMDELSLDQWAWEFLKRNQKYIKEWDRLTSHLTDAQKNFTNCYELLADLADRRAFRPELCDATIWGLRHGYLNPAPNIKYHNISFIPFWEGGPIHLISGKFKGTIINDLPFFDIQAGKVLLPFNFKQPIGPQIRNTQKELLRLQRKSKAKMRTIFKPRRHEWKLLIRIWDARVAGLKNREIARALLPNEFSRDNTAAMKAVYDKRKQAQRYIENDYRLIPFSAQYPAH